MNFFLNESLNNLSCLLKNYIYTKIQFKIAKTKEILQVSVITLICSLLLLVSSVCLWGGRVGGECRRWTREFNNLCPFLRDLG